MAEPCKRDAVLALKVYDGNLQHLREIERVPVCAAHCGTGALALIIIHGKSLVVEVAGDELCMQPLPNDTRTPEADHGSDT